MGYCRALLGTAGYYWVLGGTGCILGGRREYWGVQQGTVGYCRVLWVTEGLCGYWGYWVVLGGSGGTGEK